MINVAFKMIFFGMLTGFRIHIKLTERAIIRSRIIDTLATLGDDLGF